MKYLLLILIGMNAMADEQKTVEVKPAIVANMKNDIEVYNFGFEACTFQKGIGFHCELRNPQPQAAQAGAAQVQKKK